MLNLGNEINAVYKNKNSISQLISPYKAIVVCFALVEYDQLALKHEPNPAFRPGSRYEIAD